MRSKHKSITHFPTRTQVPSKANNPKHGQACKKIHVTSIFSHQENSSEETLCTSKMLHKNMTIKLQKERDLKIKP